MLISKKIKDAIQKEVKAQEALLKQLENQEKNYDVDLSNIKEDINNSLEYYNSILEDAA